MPRVTVTVSGLRCVIGKFELGSLDLSLPAGVSVLVGRNGAGKTTLMQCLVGLRRPQEGSVRIGGSSPYVARERSLALTRVGFVPQESALPLRVTVRQFLGYSAWLKSVPRAERGMGATEALAALGLDDLSERPIGSLSGGTQRRVAIAGALIHNPEVLVLDEPSAGLDPVQRVRLRDTLEEIGRTRTVLVSTHLVEDVDTRSFRVLALRDGGLIFVGTVDEVAGLGDERTPGSSALERGLWSLLDDGCRG